MSYDVRIAPEVVRVSRMADCLEVLRSDKVRDATPEREHTLRGGTLVTLDGAAHQRRRRLANRLVRREAHRRYRDDTLAPTVARRLAEARRTADADGIVRADLVSFGREVFLELAAVLGGIDLAGDDDRATLASLLETIHSGGNLAWLADDDTEGVREAVARGLAAHQTFRHRFYEPSLAARRELIQRSESGAISEDELPMSYLMLVALHADPAWEDEDLAVRDLERFLLGGAHTNVHPLGFVVDELEAWFVAHPEDEPLRVDAGFLDGAVNEVLRLHTATPVLLRRAAVAMALSSGLEIVAGQTIAVDAGAASRDETVYGSDASVFDPRRQVPTGAYRYGLAFSSGPHMCMGLPIVLGAQGIDGTQVHLLRALYESGLRRDPSHVARRMPANRDRYDSYPVLLDPARRMSPGTPVIA